MSMIKNNKGVLTLDFLFALLITVGLTTVLFALSFGLSMFEVIQYVAFSASRSFYAAQISIEEQKSAGTKKFEELVGTRALRPLLKSDWFKLTMNLVGAATDPLVDATVQRRYSDNPRIMGALVGTTVDVHAKFLDFQIPLLGSTTGEEGGGFKTRVTSFLGREPTQNECLEMINLRWQKITELTESTGKVPNSGTAYIPIDDNGC